MKAFKGGFYMTPWHRPVPYPVGVEPREWKPGDIILTHTSQGFFGKLIRFGQRLRYRGEDAPFAWFNHAALVVSKDGDLVEALGKGIIRTHARRYDTNYYAYVDTGLTRGEREKAVQYAERVVDLHTKYGWAQIVSISLSLLLGSKVQLGASGQNICSGFVASALQTGGYWFEKDEAVVTPAFVTPADLAHAFGTDQIRQDNDEGSSN